MTQTASNAADPTAAVSTLPGWRLAAQVAVVSCVATLTLCQYPGLLATTALVPPVVLAVAIRHTWLRTLGFVLAVWLLLCGFGLLMFGLAATLALIPVALVLPGVASVAVLPLLLWWVRPQRSVPAAVGYLACGLPFALGLASGLASTWLAQVGQASPPPVPPSVWLALWHAASLGWLVSRPRAAAGIAIPTGSGTTSR